MAIKLFAYRKTDTILHRMPALIKLVLLFAICIYTFSSGMLSTKAQVFAKTEIIKLSVGFFAVVFLFILARAPWNSLKNLKFVFVLGFFLTAFKMLHFPFYFDTDALISGLHYTFCFFITALCAQLIFESTSSLEIKDALESIQNIIAIILPPVKKLNPALVISLAINFIPMVFATWNRVHLASRARSKAKRGLLGATDNAFTQLSAFFSCLLHQAETTRMALLNRSKL